MTPAIRAAYDRLIAEGRLEPDPRQKPVIEALARVERDLMRKRRPRLFKAPEPIHGLYLHGPPGRGKSLLMDLFCANVGVQPKRRAHFHAFMAQVHDRIRVWRNGDTAERKALFGTARGDDPIRPLAELIARESRLLCFDELQVTDIADAMILGRLFEALFEMDVVLVATSNRAPEDLYKEGINRQLFLPFIDLIRERCRVVELTGARDWRLERLRRAPAWFTPDQDDAFEVLWADIRGEADESPAVLEVAGRRTVLERTAGGLARATFAELCDRPLGPSDYLALAERFHTLFLEGVPRLSPDRKEAARRFVTLIDALYEAGTRLVVEAEAEPEHLYPQGTGAFEFERTVSRLHEMRSADWMEQGSQRKPAGA